MVKVTATPCLVTTYDRRIGPLQSSFVRRLHSESSQSTRSMCALRSKADAFRPDYRLHVYGKYPSVISYRPLIYCQTAARMSVDSSCSHSRLTTIRSVPTDVF